MRLRTLSAALVALVAVLTASDPAAANSGEKISIRIENDDKVTKQYPGMVVNDASSEFTGDPETCRATPWCTVVPLEVLLAPDFNPDINEFVLNVRLSWDDRGFSAGGQSAQGNDLDMYILFAEKDKDGKTVFKEAGRSAGATQPEAAKLFTPTKKDYLVVVYNFLGVNSGFELAVSYRDASIEEIGEFATGPAARPSSGGGASFGSTVDDDSAGTDAAEVAAPPRRASTSSLSRPTPASPSGLVPAPDPFSIEAAPPVTGAGTVFDLPLPTGGARDLAQDLAAGETQDVFRPRVASANPGPVAPAVLAFWLGFVPLALAGVAAALMLRRRPAALKLQLGTS